MIEIAFRPDRQSDVAITLQLADHVAALVDAGRLVAGTRLPATRDVAAAVGIGRNTVAAAYEILTARGLLNAHVGRGTFVVPRPARAPAAKGTAPTPREFAWTGLFARGGAPRRMLAALRQEAASGPVAFDFRGGRVDADSLPAADLRWAFARPFHGRTRLRALAAHHDPLGWLPLREQLARHLAHRGLSCDPAHIAVVSGIQQAIDLTARVLVDPGDAIAMEQPGYFGATLAFAARGAEILGIDVDHEGLRTDQLARVLRLRRVKLVYLTPATHCPTGVTLSPARRHALLALADEYQVPVFEDDYDNELRYSGPPLPALKTADRAGQVIYAGTFSKILFPGLRVGYVVAAPTLLRRLVETRVVADFGSGVVEQAALAALLTTRGLERHVRKIRTLYGTRLTTMLTALRREMPAGTHWTEPRGGHLVWLTLPPRVAADRLHLAAFDGGITYSHGEGFYADDRGGNQLALAFTALAPSCIDEGITRLGALLRKHKPSHRSSHATH